jgi:hypothetical protein
VFNINERIIVMNKILVFSATLSLLLSTACQAGNVTNFDKLAIQVNSETIAGVNLVKLVDGTVKIVILNDGTLDQSYLDGTTTPLSRPLCIATDVRTSINHPIESNTVPLPGIKVTECNASDSSQLLSYSNRNITDQNNRCLTRSFPKRVYDVTNDQRICTSATVHVPVLGAMSENIYATDLAFEACNGSAEQLWDIDIKSNNKYQLKSNNACLSITGQEVLSRYRYLPQDQIDVCDKMGVQGASIRRYQNHFDISTAACSDQSTYLTIDTPSMVIEKIVPIIIPM